MPHYPIKEAAFLAAVEQQTGAPLDEANTALRKLIAELQNKAYSAGLRDGTIRQSAEIRENAPPMIEDADPAIEQLMQEWREILGAAFEKHGYDDSVQALGAFPDSMPLGDRIYCLMREAFFQGGVYAAVTSFDEEETDHDRD